MTNERDYEIWLSTLTLERVRSTLIALRCETALIKTLNRNNNSKNQIYLAPTMNHLAGIPTGEPLPNPGTSTKKGKAPGMLFSSALPFSWLSPSGVVRAPDAKLCDYTQYPEVRFSGFLKGCADPPSYLLAKEKRGTEEGRILVIGVSKSTGETYGLVVPVTVPLNAALRELPSEQQGVLRVWSFGDQHEGDSRDLLLDRLCEISCRDWIAGQRLTKDGLIPYRARNGGGYTLEAELGIISNGTAGPDFHGWEVKQHDVHSLIRPRSGEVTLFDIAPDGGEYIELGASEFARRRGRPRAGAERFDFTGKHRGTTPLETTGLRFEVLGFDGTNIDPTGAVTLVGSTGDTAMSWSFSKLLGHWNRKHSQAVFIGSEKRDVEVAGSQVREYRYGQNVELGTGTHFRRFLGGINAGTIAFDPGLKVEKGANGRWKSHARFPFRISSRELRALYTDFEELSTCDT